MSGRGRETAVEELRARSGALLVRLRMKATQAHALIGGHGSRGRLVIDTSQQIQDPVTIFGDPPAAESRGIVPDEALSFQGGGHGVTYFIRRAHQRPQNSR